MSTLQERFQILRAKRPDITNAHLARLTGAKPPSVGSWFDGKTKSLKASTAARLAEIYGVSPMWLANGSGDMNDVQQGKVDGKKPNAVNPGIPSILMEPERLKQLLMVLIEACPEDRLLDALEAAVLAVANHLQKTPNPKLDPRNAE